MEKLAGLLAGPRGHLLQRAPVEVQSHEPQDEHNWHACTIYCAISISGISALSNPFSIQHVTFFCSSNSNVGCRGKQQSDTTMLLEHNTGRLLGVPAHPPPKDSAAVAGRGVVAALLVLRWSLGECGGAPGSWESGRCHPEGQGQRLPGHLRPDCWPCRLGCWDLYEPSASAAGPEDFTWGRGRQARCCFCHVGLMSRRGGMHATTGQIRNRFAEVLHMGAGRDPRTCMTSALSTAAAGNPADGIAAAACPEGAAGTSCPAVASAWAGGGPSARGPRG